MNNERIETTRGTTENQKEREWDSTILFPFGMQNMMSFLEIKGLDNLKRLSI